MRSFCQSAALSAALFAVFGLPASADVASAVTDHIVPGYQGFAEATAALAAGAEADCSAAAMQPLWNAAFDRWMAVSHLAMGPVEEGGRNLAIAYWPDSKNAGGRTLKGILEAADPALTTPEGVAQISVAARGLFGLERLLYPEAEGAYACDLRRALAADLAETAAAVSAAWGMPGAGGYADALITAGQPGNSTYLTQDEAKQALYTALVTGLEFTSDSRLGRPLGSFDRPYPDRAEALASGRPLRNIQLSLAALHQLALDLVPAEEMPVTEAAFQRAQKLAQELPDPTLAGVASPGGRLKVEIVQQAIEAARDGVRAEVSPALGVGLGLNAADGD